MGSPALINSDGSMRNMPQGGGGGGAGLSTAGLPAYTPPGGVPMAAVAAGAVADIIIATVLINGIAHKVKWDNNTGQIVEDLGPVDPAEQTYDDNGDPSGAENRYIDFKDAQSETGNFEPRDQGAPPPASDGGGAPAGGGGGGGGGGGSYEASPSSGGGSSGGGGGGRSSGSGRSSGGGSSGGAAADDDAPVAAFPFSGGFGSTPNSYPTLPMTAQRRAALEGLSGAFGQDVGTFRTPPGGWREDMAPMFTTGAFGGLAPAGGQQAAPEIPGGMPPQSAAPALPSPTQMPPDMAIGLMPPQMQQAAPAPQGFPAFNQPGFVAPGSPYDMQMQRIQQRSGGNAAPLPASLRQRFGL